MNSSLFFAFFFNYFQQNYLSSNLQFYKKIEIVIMNMICHDVEVSNGLKSLSLSPFCSEITKIIIS